MGLGTETATMIDDTQMAIGLTDDINPIEDRFRSVGLDEDMEGADLQSR
jgi:hypothetical protein